MGLLFEIIQGQRKGARFKVRSGMRIGRKHADITLEDPKVSGSHAHIEEGNSGELILVDDKSSNGVRVQGRKVPRMTLTEGAQFQIGETHFAVIEENTSGR